MPAHVSRVGALLAVVAITIAAIAHHEDVAANAGDAPAVSFTAPASIAEGEAAVFTFRRTGDLTDRLAVNLEFYFEGQFLLSEEMDELWFEAGEAEAILSIATVDDSTPEPDGSIGVLLQPRYYDPDPNYPQPYQPQEPVYHQVIVLDND